MSGIRRIEPGSRLSEAVVHGSKIYTAGVVPDSAAGKSITEQTHDVLAQVDALLASAGSDKSKLIKVNIWLSDITTIAEMNAVWDLWVIPGQTPARATVEARLADPSWGVEMMVEAAI